VAKRQRRTAGQMPWHGPADPRLTQGHLRDSHFILTQFSRSNSASDRKLGDRQPISRVLSVRGDAHRTVIPLGVQSPERSSSLPAARCLATSLRDGTPLAAYLALLRLGFAEPLTLPPMRWALAPPFHPYHSFRCGGLFSVALSVTRSSRRARPGVTWQPTLWSPDFPR
jgi:hypothetical protein